MRPLAQVFVAAAVFLIVCAAGVFCFWIGGGEPFTLAAGYMSITTLVTAGGLSAVAYLSTGAGA